MASLAIAQPVHEHHQHKREAGVEYVTVYQTQIVTQGVDGSSSVVQSQSTQGNTASLSGSSYQTVLLNGGSSSASSTTDSIAAVPSSVGSSTESYSSTASQSSSTASSSSSSDASGAKGITYSPYTNSGSCKDSSTIKSDIEMLSDFDVIRLYDTDCSGVEAVLSAKTSSQKLFAGIYYISKIADSVSIIKSAVEEYGSWDDIYTVSIGNELVNSGDATVSEIKSAVESTRSELEDAGYTGKVVSVDTLVAVQDNTDLCEYSDYIAVNSHPFWDGSVVASDSGSWLKTQIANIKKTCGGSKSVLITETGWPTQGDDYGVAVPSKSNQEAALKSIVEEVGDQVILFTTYNDLWKAAGSYGVEQYWGIFD